MKPYQLLLSLVLLLLPACTRAQGGNNNNNGGDKVTSQPTVSTAVQTRTPSPAKTSTSTTAKANLNLPRPDTTTTTAISITSASGDPDLPRASDDVPLPKASDDQEYQIPVITPPPTRGAPFMQQSDLPEGTVFIAVGSGLALCALVVLAWRGLVAWSLHRSVKRATAQPPGVIDSKSMLRPHKGGQGASFYAAGAGSMHSLDHLASTNRSSSIPPPPSSSLFFSPTSNAGAALPSGGTLGTLGTLGGGGSGGGGGGGGGAGERRSAYLPSGFYTAGNRASVPSNSSQTQFGRPIRGSGVSPPGTPLMAPLSQRASSSGTERVTGLRVSESQTSLNVPPTGRAPSAYLEDLFESHPIPEQHPSQGGRF